MRASSRRGSAWGLVAIAAGVSALVIGAMLVLPNLTGNASSPAATTQPLPLPTLPNGAPAPALPAAAEDATRALPTLAAPPTPAPMPTPVVIEHVVASGETCSAIALRYGVSLETLALVNNLDLNNNCPIYVGQTLKILLPTPTPSTAQALAQSIAPSAPAAPITHVVQPNETCSAIALRYNIPLETLRAQNNLDEQCIIRVGQTLIIARNAPQPEEAAAAPIVMQTPTPRSGYPAPVLLVPADGARVEAEQTTITLQWLAVGLLQPNEWYVVQVQPEDGDRALLFETKATSLKLNRDILGEQPERTLVWWVQVKRRLSSEIVNPEQRYTPLSPPSAARRFTWRQPLAATPTP